ncbi:MAG: hypothetical protein IKC32_06275 [Clostridia bacterium]|nr:hypothetical protein [Clostridia bacterium]
MIYPADRLAFADAIRRVALEEELSPGFTVYSEKQIHKTVKLYREPDASRHEQTIDGGVADILNENGITEVQTAAFHPLLPKLKRWLPEHRVELVHPFPVRTVHKWLDPKTHELISPKREGPKRSLVSVARNLYAIRELIGCENLTVTLLLMDIEEYRRLDGRGKDRKRGATLIGKLPRSIEGELRLKEVEDYRFLLPFSRGEVFRMDEYLRAMGARSRFDRLAVKLLIHLGMVEEVGKEGRAILYMAK